MTECQTNEIRFIVCGRGIPPAGRQWGAARVVTLVCLVAGIAPLLAPIEWTASLMRRSISNAALIAVTLSFTSLLVLLALALLYSSRESRLAQMIPTGNIEGRICIKGWPSQLASFLSIHPQEFAPRIHRVVFPLRLSRKPRLLGVAFAALCVAVATGVVTQRTIISQLAVLVAILSAGAAILAARGHAIYYRVSPGRIEEIAVPWLSQTQVLCRDIRMAGCACEIALSDGRRVAKLQIGDITEVIELGAVRDPEGFARDIASAVVTPPLKSD